MPADLQHRVTSPEIEEFASREDPDQISGRVRAASERRMPPIPQHDRGALDHQLTFLSNPGQHAIVSYCVHSVATGGRADRDWLAQLQAGNFMSRADVGLGRTIEIE